MRLALVILACGALAALGILDGVKGQIPVGIAGVMLAIANGILLTR